MLAMTMNVLIDKNSIFYYNSNTYSRRSVSFVEEAFYRLKTFSFIYSEEGFEWCNQPPRPALREEGVLGEFNRGSKRLVCLTAAKGLRGQNRS